ncbi:MAG: murein biosynthesis integral membrane protein MurJ, partial [Mycobacteriaceae bacterium]|nr:murein biosynthesis integral membrane protein MurJ [Mycobacteriaceae bacterium]
MVYYPQLTTPPQEWDYDDAPPEASDRGNKRLLASSGSIAVATLTSRITGFFKSMLLLAVLGSAVASSYTVASQIPNMISEFVLGAVLSAIVVPVLVRAEREDPDGGATFVRRLCTAAFTMLTIATILAVGTASFLVPHFFLPENGAVNTGLTTALSYLLLPAVLFYGMSALFTAILNTRQVFKPGAWAPVLNNVVVLVVLGIYFLVPGEISLDRVRLSDPKLLLLGVGLTLGVVMQALCLLPAIRRERIDLRPLWGIDDRLKRAAGMGAAIVLYVAISQAGLVFGTRIAAAHDAAGPAIYQTAWMLLQLPYGVLGVTVLTAIMPRLSRNAAEDDTPAVVDDLSVATRLTMIALIPVVLFMTLTGRQMGEALYGHGNMTFHEAGRLGLAVSFSAFTLIPYALVLIHLRVFYAREQAWTPTWIILGITGVKVALSALVPVLVHDKDKVVLGLGLVNGLAFITGAVIGGILLHRSLGELRMVNVGRTVWRVVLASAAGGVTVLIADRALKLQRLTDSHLWLGSGLRVALAGCLMLAVTFAIMWLSGVPEIVGLTVAIMRRLGLRAAPADAPEEPKHRPYDPLMDAETMILPVIRARAVDTTGAGDFPYPVRQRGAGPTAESGSAHEGAMVSDDAVTGLPTGRRNPDVGMGVGSTGTVPPGNVMPGRQMHTGMGPADEDRVDQVVSQQES